MLYIPRLASLRVNALLAFLAVALAAGCSSGSRPELTDASIAFPCQRAPYPDPNGVCQHTCTPDPGPRLVECAKPERDLDFTYLWTFDETDSEPDETHARAMYSYTDNTNSIATFLSRANAPARPTSHPPR